MRVSAPLGAVCPPTRNPKTYPHKPIKGKGMPWLGFIPDFARLAWLGFSGFPLSRE